MDNALPSQLSGFVDEQKYQAISQEMLALAKKLGATQAEMGMHASIGLSITSRLNEVETLEFNRDKSLAITVYIDNCKGSASTTDISPESIEATVKAAINVAKLTESDPYAGLALASEMAQHLPELELYHPWHLTVEEAIHLTKECEQHALAFDKRIVNSEGATLSSTQGYQLYANSHDFLGFYPASRHSLSCAVIAQDAQGMERDYQYTIARDANDLANAAQIGKEAAQKAFKRLSAKKLPTQRVPVLYHASIASSLLNHFIGAISGGRLFRQSTFLLNSLHTKVFPSHIKIYEQPHLKGALGSAPFDNDGVRTNGKHIIDDGILQSYILSAYSARKLGLPNTGNAGGVHNLFIEAGDKDYTALLKEMGRGLVVTELMGPGINMVTGDYSRGAAGFWVENGQIQYPVHEITIAGNLAQMFKNLVAVGNDIDKRGSIYTGSLLIEEMTLAGV